MEQFIIILLVLIVSFYVSYPYFIGGTSKTADSSSSDLLEKLTEQKELYISEIKDIEFDYGLGKLSKNDYKELLQSYKLKAASVIKKMDEIKKDKNLVEIEEQLEKEVLAFRKVNS